ncbi:MAG TPA: cupin domain-containing protein [Streptosporangiaceae bacterium]|nr:cupin domain-containing protein [Streptosporangiaceae bacterium]
MRNYSFEDFVGDPGGFLTESFNKKPAYYPGQMTGKLEDLPGIDVLDDLLALEAVSPSYLRVTKNGQSVPRHTYTRVTGDRAALSDAVVPERVFELFRTGGTVTWNSLEHILPHTRRLLDPFARTFASRTDLVLFVTPAGHEGFRPHHDSVDVYVLQLAGTKRWRVWETPEGRQAQMGSDDAEELGEPLLTTTLRPGDVLYVPYGTPHAAAAEDSISVHLSIGVVPRHWSDLIRESVIAITGSEEFGEFPLLAPGYEDDARKKLAVLLARVRELLASLDADVELDRLADAGRREGELTGFREFERLSVIDRLTGDSVLTRSSLEIELGDSDGKKTTIGANGIKIAIPNAMARLLSESRPGAQLSAGSLLPGAPRARSVIAAQRLARLGVLDVAAIGSAQVADDTPA